MKMVVNVEGVTYDVSAINYRPQTKFAKVMFLQVSVCPWGGHVWLLRGVCVVALGGACVVAPGQGGHAWLLQGGHAWFLRGWGGVRGCSRPGGACMVAPRGGMRDCSGGCAWLLPGGACVVALGGCVVFSMRYGQ